MTPDRTRRAARLELIFSALIVLGVAFALWRLRTDGYLPQPFFHDPSDPLMDLFNTAYWAHRPDMYATWRAVYPPLSFLFLKGVTLQHCYANGAVFGRDCDWLAKAVLFGFYGLGAALVFRSLRALETPSVWPRTIALCLGLPMLYGLDRGNLLIVAFAFLLLGLEAGLPSRSWRRAALAIAFNFKPYLLVLLIPEIVARNWRQLGLVIGAAALVYGMSLLWLGSGTPAELVSNVAYLMAKTRHNDWNNLYYATTYHALIDSLGHGHRIWPAQALNLPIWLGQIAGAACLWQAWRRPQAVSPDILAALCLSLIMSSFGASGYVEIFLVYFVFRQGWASPASAVCLVAAYLLCLPLDVVIWPLPQPPSYSYWGHVVVTPHLGVSVGQWLRPALILAIQYGLIWQAFAAVRAAPGSRPGPARGSNPSPLATSGAVSRGSVCD